LASVFSRVQDQRAEEERNGNDFERMVDAINSHTFSTEGLGVCKSRFVDIFDYSVGGFASASYFEHHGKK
jgi:hypothetical protein